MSFPIMPDTVQKHALLLWNDLLAVIPKGVAFTKHDRQEILHVFACSDFVAQYAKRANAAFIELWQSGDLQRIYAEGAMYKKLEHKLASITHEAALMDALREFRQREMVRIAWRDLVVRANLNETLDDLSTLADSCIQLALQFLYPAHCQIWGTPVDDNGQAQHLLVIGMGKLGAYELNFSSDIDLIFVYAEKGVTQGVRSISNEQFFIHLGQALIRVLDQITAKGQVFRVDMRLRPFGQSGPLVMNMDALETYYAKHGREWERYALIKARIIDGDGQQAIQLNRILRPFVYRRYIDFSVFESLRDMKVMIQREVRKKQADHNIKLGRGGIREIEFIAQAFQLIRGGQEIRLQQRPVQVILPLLQELNLLPEQVVQELLSAYQFLRLTENRLQAVEDKQIHVLPKEDLAQTRLAYSMGFTSWEYFLDVLERHRQRVENHFSQVFSAPQTEQQTSDLQQELSALWLQSIDHEQALKILKRIDLADQNVFIALDGLRHSRTYKHISQQGLQRLNKLIPLLLGALSNAKNKGVALQRILELIENICQRSAYIALLTENPMALSQLVKLCDVSPWISHYLARYPALLDELLDARELYKPLQKAILSQQLKDIMLSVTGQEVEQRMERLRHFRHSQVLRVAAADISGKVPIMKVSDYLTEIAEVCLQDILEEAWMDMVQRYGVPGSGQVRRDKGFAIIAYGKLGSIELGYGSDLDLVFLYHDAYDQHVTEGEKSIDNKIFYTRLGQRIIHMLDAKMAGGILYEVDMRLRPDGKSGMLVHSLSAFEYYQKKKAWTWEHQALVRARYITGDASLETAFMQVRKDILTQAQDKKVLRQTVLDMREKMQKELEIKKKGYFDLKQSPGGITDIEFIVQYYVLAYACEYPDLTRYTDNIRILELLQTFTLLSEQDVRMLIHAYKTYRMHLHCLALQEKAEKVIAQEEIKKESLSIKMIWQAVFSVD